MPLTVVGSIAYDAVKTPSGSRERMLGGSAVHFALAAAFFDEVRVVGPVGDDFAESDIELLSSRGVETTDIERMSGKTFFWAGEYGWDLNERETLDTQLGVFADFQPKLGDASKGSETLFLANIQPDLQRDVRAQCSAAGFAALDSMNLWIDVARDSLISALADVDCLMLNDAELRQLTGEPNLVRAAAKVRSWGPSTVVAKRGEYGAAMISPEGFFALPAFPLQDVIDPTGAGDSFAGGFMGYLSARAGETPGHDALCQAMAYGTALASFNVEEFGTERVARLTGEEITERVQALGRMTSFTAAPAALRA